MLLATVKRETLGLHVCDGSMLIIILNVHSLRMGKWWGGKGMKTVAELGFRVWNSEPQHATANHSKKVTSLYK